MRAEFTFVPEPIQNPCITPGIFLEGHLRRRFERRYIPAFEAFARNLMGQTNPPFMSGVPELLVLRLLVRKEMYGYELVKAIRAATSEAIGLGEGVVYPSLYGLERKGALKARRKTVNGRSRVYYKVTAKGRRRLDELTERWQKVTGGIRAALGEPGRA